VCIVARLCKCVIVAGSLSLIGGCQSVGPVAIDQGRGRYNHIIQETSKEQTFANIIRVKHHEPTTFMDVTEVDATTTFSGTASGGLTNIGATAGLRSTTAGTINGEIGNIAGGVTYTESPLIRYQPLLGQALVAQLATPISPDVIWSLYDSGWNVAPLLDLSTGFLTLDSDEFYAVLNTIAELDGEGRLQIVAEKSDLTKAKDQMASGKLTPDKNGSVVLQVTNKAANSGTSDALVLYFLPYHPHSPNERPSRKARDNVLWLQLLRLYAGTQLNCLTNTEQPPADGTPAATAQQSSAGTAPSSGSSPTPGGTTPQPSVATASNSRGPTVPQCTPRPADSIEVRTMPVTPANRIHKWMVDGEIRKQTISGAPLMRTNSALGILTTATGQPNPRIIFLAPEDYANIRSYIWNDPGRKDPDLTYYTLNPTDETTGDEGPVSSPPTPEMAELNRITVQWLTKYAEGDSPTRVYLPPNPEQHFNEFVQVNRRLGHLRRYILIIRSSAPPPIDAYVAHFDHGEWYYIAGDDEISQKNFHLISLFLTMMAVPSTTPPLAPTISVGGGM
jgi:hypothetical protein